MTCSRFGHGGWCLPAYALCVLLLRGAPVQGALPSAQWLPSDVKFYFSIADYPVSKPLFDQTGVGRLLNDEAMQPFLKDVPRQLRQRARASWLGLMWVELGVDWSQFRDVPRGEVAWAVFDVQGAPSALLCADVTGKDEEVKRLQGEIAAAMSKQGISATREDVDGTELTVYELPKRDAMEASSLVYFVRQGVFVATRQAELARRMVGRVGVEQRDNLTGLASYQQVMRECRAASQDEPHALLYAIPFDCVELMNKVAEQKKIEVDATPELYRSQGFDALSAIGATAYFGGDTSDMRFFASLYAPKPWSKSMQMIDLRNSSLALEDWIGSKVAACSVLNLSADSVCANLGPFFDEVIARGVEGTWADILAALRDDEDGPRLDLNKEVLSYLTGPVLVLEAESLPVTPESPQVLLAVKASDEARLRAGIKKAMQNDPLISTQVIAGTTCYFSTSQEDQDALLWILCVANSHLYMANDFDIVTSILQKQVGTPLSGDAGFQSAKALWKQQLPGDSSGMVFYRLDGWLQVRYELLREGKSIVSRKSLSGMVNNFLGGEPIEEEKPALDGSKLPPFEKIRHYLGTLDASVTTVENGWLLVGHIRDK